MHGIFGDHDKTCCWMDGLYSHDSSLSGDTVAEEKDTGDEFEGGWVRTAIIAAGAAAVALIAAKMLEKGGK